MLQFLLKFLAFIAVVYVCAMLALYFGQRKLMYHPDPSHVLPESLGLTEFREVPFETTDGNRIVTWQVDPAPGQPTLLYFHGNGGTLASRGGRLQALAENGLGIVIMSYRGSSGSTGAPSEAANTSDARALYDQLIARGVPASDIIVYGESIGTGVATRLASSVDIGGLVLDSPFTSLVDRAAELYPYFWVRPFITDRYPVRDLIADIDAPLLIVHGALDQVIPVHMAKSVFAAAEEPKTLKVFPQGNHVDLYNHGALATVLEFARQIRNVSAD